MAILDTLITFSFKIAVFAIGIALSTVPAIYIFGSDPIHTQLEHALMLQFSNRLPQIDKISEYSITNIYLREGPRKLGWSDINQTIYLADYICAELDKKGTVVTRKHLAFKEPRRSKAGNQQVLNVEYAQKIDDAPALHWLKIVLEGHIGFEHQTIAQKQWVIVAFDELSVKTAAEIARIQERNPQNKFLIVSVWPLGKKSIDAAIIGLDRVDSAVTTQSTTTTAPPAQPQVEEPAAEIPAEPVEETTPPPPVQTEEKKSKKKEKNYRVKKVKKEVETVEPQAVETEAAQSEAPQQEL